MQSIKAWKSEFLLVDFLCPELVGTPCIEHRQQLKPEGVGGTAGGRLQLRLLVQEASDDAQQLCTCGEAQERK